MFFLEPPSQNGGLQRSLPYAVTYPWDEEGLLCAYTDFIGNLAAGHELRYDLIQGKLYVRQVLSSG